MSEQNHPYEYEIEELANRDSWHMFRIIGEFVEGFDALAGIEPAITIYGSARELKPDHPLYVKTEEIAFRLAKQGFSIITGGGPGTMEAANKGALRGEARSVGLNIKLPRSKSPTISPPRRLTFRYFFVRKVMLVKYASAFIFMPGGLGTLDELTEVLTLMQTHKIKPFPVILVDSDYWKGLLDWMRNTVLAQGFISEEDLNLLRVCDTVDEVVDAVQHVAAQAPAGRQESRQPVNDALPAAMKPPEQPQSEAASGRAFRPFGGRRAGSRASSLRRAWQRRQLWLAWPGYSDTLIAVKIVGTLLAIYLLWILHYRRPRIMLLATIAVVCWYTLVVFWNVSIVVVGSR